MRNLRLLWLVIKRSEAIQFLSGFMVMYAIAAFVLFLVEPEITTYADALWFLWAVGTTVGLGDLTAVTPIGRACTVLISLSAIVTTAIITGVIVDFFNEKRQAQLKSSLSEFLDKLEHLHELDKDELKDLSRRVREFRR